MVASWMPASTPPATITSASPRRMVSQASPSAWPPVAHAETVAKLGPMAPHAIAIWPAPTFAIPIGMKNGEIRSGPRSAMTRTLSNSVWTPPRPEPRITPVRSASRVVEPARQAGILQRLARGHQPELDVAVGAPDLLAVEDPGRVEVLDGADDPAVEPRRVEGVDRRDAGAARDEAVPRRTHVLPERAQRAHAGDDDAPRGVGPAPAHRTGFPVRTVAARYTSPGRPRAEIALATVRTSYSVRRITALASPSATVTIAHEAVGSPSNT